MNVASLELSKELYELSGWEAMQGHYKAAQTVNLLPSEQICPAYDLGFLLRKLQPVAPEIEYKLETSLWEARDRSHTYFERDLTPEDAAASLCIELFKQNILKRSE